MNPTFAVTTTLNAENVTLYQSTQKTDNIHEALQFVSARKKEVSNVYPSMNVTDTKTGFVGETKNGLRLTVSFREDVSQYEKRIAELEAAAKKEQPQEVLAVAVFGIVLLG